LLKLAFRERLDANAGGEIICFRRLHALYSLKFLIDPVCAISSCSVSCSDVVWFWIVPDEFLRLCLLLAVSFLLLNKHRHLVLWIPAHFVFTVW
jgi:hypothetical protein